MVCLYEDDIVVFAESKDELQQSLDALLEYCNRWKLVVNTRKTKINFTYLGSSFSEAQSALSGQALKAIFQMNKYLHNFTSLSVQHRLYLFEMLITPILNYGGQVWGFAWYMY